MSSLKCILIIFMFHSQSRCSISYIILVFILCTFSYSTVSSVRLKVQNCAIFKMSTKQGFIQQQDDVLHCIHTAVPDDPKHFLSFFYGGCFTLSQWFQRADNSDSKPHLKVPAFLPLCVYVYIHVYKIFVF